MTESSILLTIRLGQEAYDALAIFYFEEHIMERKAFKTHNQQLNILRERGLTVPKNGIPKRFLEEENYYNVINGYKDLFLKRDNRNRTIFPEAFKEGTHFDELKYLYLFDRELRSIFLRNILIFENLIKSTISHEFTKKYNKKNSYLDLQNFKDNDHKLALEQISNLLKIIHKKSGRTGSIQHYVSTYGEVPLWVLVNYLTLGNVSYFYSILDDDLQNTIALVFSLKYNRQYNTSNTFFSSADMQSILKATNLVRNIAAHEERLYSQNIGNVRCFDISSNVSLNSDYFRNNRIAVLIPLLKAVLNKKDFNLLKKDLLQLFDKYNHKFHTVSFNDILKSMGIINVELLN